MTDSANQHEALSTRLDGMMERISAAHGRLEAASAQLEREGAAQRTDIGELRESTRQCQSDIAKMTECLELGTLSECSRHRAIFTLDLRPLL